MAKRKRNNATSNAIKKQATATGIPSPPHDGNGLIGPASLQSVTSPEEVEIAVETLQALAEHPALIKSKACKDLRTAVYSFRQASTTGMISAGRYQSYLYRQP